MPTRELFGGAITANLPADLVDASDLRQIPDSQEVLLAPDSDNSFILDIVQSVCPADPTDALRFHLDSVAHDNDAASFEVVWLKPQPFDAASSSQSTPQPALAFSRQRISKFRQDNSAENLDLVDIYLALWRLPSKNVDLVLTMNIPRGNAAKLSAAAGDAQDESSPERTQFEAAAQSLKIVNFGLFVDPQ